MFNAVCFHSSHLSPAAVISRTFGTSAESSRIDVKIKINQEHSVLLLIITCFSWLLLWYFSPFCFALTLYHLLICIVAPNLRHLSLYLKGPIQNKHIVLFVSKSFSVFLQYSSKIYDVQADELWRKKHNFRKYCAWTNNLLHGLFDIPEKWSVAEF